MYALYFFLINLYKILPFITNIIIQKNCVNETCSIRQKKRKEKKNPIFDATRARYISRVERCVKCAAMFSRRMKIVGDDPYEGRFIEGLNGEGRRGDLVKTAWQPRLCQRLCQSYVNRGTLPTAGRYFHIVVTTTVFIGTTTGDACAPPERTIVRGTIFLLSLPNRFVQQFVYTAR